MSDIKRNNNNNQPEKRTDVKPVKGEVKKSTGPTQVHFGNVEALKLKLMEAQNNTLLNIYNALKVIAEKK